MCCKMCEVEQKIDKHARYRLAHPERTRAATAAWYALHRDDVLQKRRDRYRANREAVKEQRCEHYVANREAILAKARSKKTECPQCKLMYTSWYLKKHLETRHKIFCE